MILLDTNIISEFMRPTPQTQVMQWLHQQALTDLFISSVTVTEVMYGLNRLPEGKRKQSLLLQFQQLLDQAIVEESEYSGIYGGEEDLEPTQAPELFEQFLDQRYDYGQEEIPIGKKRQGIKAIKLA